MCFAKDIISNSLDEVMAVVDEIATLCLIGQINGWLITIKQIPVYRIVKTPTDY